jgi:hypothetical protein
MNMGLVRARKLFKDEAYPFPFQFEKDAVRIVKECFLQLSADKADNEEFLKSIMVEGLAKKYVEGFKSLRQDSKVPSYLLHSVSGMKINGMHFTYGPFPPPEGYIGQEWFDLITIMLPKEDAVFESHPRQKQLMERAEGEGCHIRIDTTVELDLEFVLSNAQSLPLLRDRREFVDISFTSPHFTPWDTIFDLDADGNWKLNWNWKIANISTKYI